MSVGVRTSADGTNRLALPTGLRISMYLVCAYVLVQGVSIIRPTASLSIDTFANLAAVFLILDVVMVVLVFRRARAAEPYGITICVLNLLGAAANLWSEIQLVELSVMLDVAHIAIFRIVLGVANFAIFLLALVFLARWRGQRAPARAMAAGS
jgi:hypothetical protein